MQKSLGVTHGCGVAGRLRCWRDGRLGGCGEANRERWERRAWVRGERRARGSGRALGSEPGGAGELGPKGGEPHNFPL